MKTIQYHDCNWYTLIPSVLYTVVMKPGPKPKRDKVYWSPELAYAVGLITTDGCLYNDGRHISLTSKDVDQLQTFLRCIEREDVRITEKSGGYRKKITHAQFSDVGLYIFLLAVGLTPNKTKTLGVLAIPDEYFWDFVRGLFDGDGCSYSFYDSIYKRSYRFYISFASASPAFVDWLREKVRAIAGIRGHVGRRPGKSYLDLKYSKREAVQLARLMYHHNDVPALSRKRLKALAALTIAEESMAQVACRRKRARIGLSW